MWEWEGTKRMQKWFKREKAIYHTMPLLPSTPHNLPSSLLTSTSHNFPSSLLTSTPHNLPSSLLTTPHLHSSQPPSLPPLTTSPPHL